MIRVGRYSHLTRERLRLDNGDVLVRPWVKYIQDMIELLGMTKAKPAACPSLAEDRPADDTPLDEAAARAYRSCVGIAL